jgi:hypothetical protein
MCAVADSDFWMLCLLVAQKGGWNGPRPSFGGSRFFPPGGKWTLAHLFIYEK